MCGRARCTLKPEEVCKACGYANVSIPQRQIDRYRPSYNVSPGSYLPILCKEADSPEGVVLSCMKWGLVPSFAKKNAKPDHYRMFNARSETIKDKGSFSRLIPNNRCLVAVEGFYEWKKDGSKKQPYYIHLKDHHPLVFAALYDSWMDSDGEVLHTFTILTTRCSRSLLWLHDRMPVILGNKSSIDMWINGSPSSPFDKILEPYEDSDLIWYPVTSAMGKPSFDGLECIKEIQLKPGEKSISKFFSKKDDMKAEPKILDEISHEQSVHTAESLKSEPITEEYGLLSSPFQSPCENTLKKFVDFPLKEKNEEYKKRDYEEFTSNQRLLTNDADTTFSSCEKKKVKLEESGKAQPTLHSYFIRR